MAINLYEARNQASRAAGYAGDLRSAYRDLQQYHSNLQQYWKADEMAYINRAIKDLLQKMSAVSSELDSLGNDIYNAAEAAKRSEDLSAAQTELRDVQNDMDVAKRNYDSAVKIYNASPNPITEAALRKTQNTYNEAIAKYNASADKVRSLL